jgi:diguanylate cyclase (GGDEF)-like protein
MLFLNLDRFEVIRDNLGVEAGQHTLDVIGRRLQTCLRAADLLGRLRGDEFAILLAAPSRQEEAAIVAERIAEQLRAPLSIGDQQLTLTASIGVALAEPGQDAAGLIRNADIAMCQAKDGGRARYRVFDPAMRAQAWERMHLETALHRAIEHDEFRVFYQPMVDLATGQVIGCEALVRWLDPEHGLISPSVFIPVAEETGMIVPIGRRVLETACAQAAAWQHSGCFARPRFVSVNLSARQLEHSDDLLATVEAALTDHRLDPSLLKLEITESAVMRDPELAIATLWALKGLGVRIAVDDFGTGYSSLAYLKRFPVDTLKIDRSFVDGVAYLPEDQAIVGATVAFASALGMTVVAEGIESEDQADVVRGLGCHLGQGYLWGKPAPASTVERPQTLAA